MVVFARRRGLALGLVAVALVLALAPTAAEAAPGGGAPAGRGEAPPVVQWVWDLMARVFQWNGVGEAALGRSPAPAVEKAASGYDPFGGR